MAQPSLVPTTHALISENSSSFSGTQYLQSLRLPFQRQLEPQLWNVGKHGKLIKLLAFIIGSWHIRILINHISWTFIGRCWGMMGTTKSACMSSPGKIFYAELKRTFPCLWTNLPSRTD